ncbi:hypothetical protein SELMODRAFT_421833 [Selaginella moellendorffii]|uniref:Uncharacterized protein n=1 Tax=Selaginella moellendorffii TaxID=88036 RepID=D8SGI0_SELML|nr:hypothetical protein SELMODRAFT_421833 [Selaginella moellendorffii]
MVEMKTHGKKTVEGETFFLKGKPVFFNAFFQESLSLRLHTMSLYSKMPSKRPLTSHGTCRIVNRPSDHNGAVQRLPCAQDFHPDRLEKHSTIQPEHLYNTLISMEQNRQLLPESLDGIAYIDMLGREIAIMHLKRLLESISAAICQARHYL